MENIKVLIENDLNDDASLLRREVFIIEQGFSVEDEYDSNEKDYIHISLYDNNLLIAYCRIHLEENVSHIGRVLVKKEFRNKGYGRKIMELAENESKKYNISSYYLHSQLHAVPFYEKCGYMTSGEMFLEAGAPHFMMVKSI